MIMTGHGDGSCYTTELLSRISEMDTSLKGYESRVANYGFVGSLMNYVDLNVAVLKGMRSYYKWLLAQD